MAQIRLSQGFSDIKGKSNGSVFSSNKNGKYFRNNSVGGGRISPLWDSKKTILSSVAQLWKNMTRQQQDAWELAATQIPKKNMVGEVVFWSGFNYFCSVNAMRGSNGAGPISLPPAAASFPEIPPYEVKAPEFPLFQPNVVTRIAATVPSTGFTEFQIDFDNPPAIGEPVPGGTIWGDVDWDAACAADPNCQYDICTDTYSNGNYTQVSITKDPNGVPHLTVTHDDGVNTPTTNKTVLDALDLSKPFIVSWTMHMDPDPMFVAVCSYASDSVRINLPSDMKNTETFVSRNITYTNSDDSASVPFRFVQVTTPALDDSELFAIVQGYLTNNVIAAASMAIIDSYQFKQDIVDNPAIRFIAHGLTEPALIRTQATFVQKPFIYIKSLPGLAPGLLYRIKISPAVSRGRRGAYSRYKQLAMVSHPDTEDLNIGALFYDDMPYMPSKSMVKIELSVVDEDFTQESPKVIGELSSTLEFKAGVDLATSVRS